MSGGTHSPSEGPAKSRRESGHGPLRHMTLYYSPCFGSTSVSRPSGGTVNSPSCEKITRARTVLHISVDWEQTLFKLPIMIIAPVPTEVGD